MLDANVEISEYEIRSGSLDFFFHSFRVSFPPSATQMHAFILQDTHPLRNANYTSTVSQISGRETQRRVIQSSSGESRANTETPSHERDTMASRARDDYRTFVREAKAHGSGSDADGFKYGYVGSPPLSLLAARANCVRAFEIFRAPVRHVRIARDCVICEISRRATLAWLPQILRQTSH